MSSFFMLSEANLVWCINDENEYLVKTQLNELWNALYLAIAAEANCKIPTEKVKKSGKKYLTKFKLKVEV